MFKKNQILSKNEPIRIAFLASLGSGLEYYDFVIYGMMAKYLSDIFFNAQDQFSSLVQTFIIFAVGYLMRPLGGIVVGMIADTYGRKKAFVVVMLMMAFSTMGIGLLPTYSQVGIVASIGLLLCRLCQGLSFGAEFPGAATIVSEFSPKDRIGKLCSLVLSSMSLGSLMATAVLALLTNMCDYNDIVAGFWRIPFIFGGILAIISFYIRRNISETPEFLDRNKTKSPRKMTMILLNLFTLDNAPIIAIAFGLTFFLATMVIVNLYFPVYMNQYYNYQLTDIYNAMTVSMVWSCIFMLFFGWLADRLSKLKILFVCLSLYGAFLFKFFALLDYKTLWALQVFFIIHQMVIAVFFTSYLPIFSRLFARDIRYTGIGLVYNVAFSLASFIPIVASFLLEQYNSHFVLWLALIMIIVAAFFAVILLIMRGKGQYLH